MRNAHQTAVSRRDGSDGGGSDSRGVRWGLRDQYRRTDEGGRNGCIHDRRVHDGSADCGSKRRIADDGRECSCANDGRGFTCGGWHHPSRQGESAD